MSKIEKLILKLCPDGIQFIPLDLVSSVSTGDQLNKELLSQNGQYPVMNGGISPSGFYDEFNNEAETTVISQGGASAGFVTWMDSKFWAGAHLFVVKPKQDLINARYLYHFIKSKEIDVQAMKTGAGIPGLNRSRLIELRVPVPPLEIQNEIVRILDTFSELELELESELEARKTQFEYYRKKLFDSDNNLLKIKDICTRVSSGGTPSRSVSRYFEGDIPWVRTQEVDFNTINETQIRITEEAVRSSAAQLVPENTVILAMYGATAGKSAITSIPVTTNQACCNLELELTKCLPRYLFHWLMANYQEIKSLGQGTQSNINADIVKNLVLPVPLISEQRKIVKILDQFYELNTDTSFGLPAEINARRTQYEYYRDKLLTFKELESA